MIRDSLGSLRSEYEESFQILISEVAQEVETTIRLVGKCQVPDIIKATMFDYTTIMLLGETATPWGTGYSMATRRILSGIPSSEMHNTQYTPAKDLPNLF